MGDPLLQSLSEFSLYNPASAKSYRPLHLILRCLSGFPNVFAEVSASARLVRVARFPLP